MRGSFSVGKARAGSQGPPPASPLIYTIPEVTLRRLDGQSGCSHKFSMKCLISLKQQNGPRKELKNKDSQNAGHHQIVGRNNKVAKLKRWETWGFEESFKLGHP